MRDWTGHADRISSIAFGPSGKAISVGGEYTIRSRGDQTIRVWNLDTGTTDRVISGIWFNNQWRKVIYNENAKLAATFTYQDRHAYLWNIDTGRRVRDLDCGYCVDDIAFSTDGKRLATAGLTDVKTRNSGVKIWNVQTGVEVQHIKTALIAWRVALSPDGKRLVCGYLNWADTSEDRLVRVYDVDSGQELKRYAWPSGTESFRALAFFPNGRRIVSADSPGNVRIWRAPR